MRRCLLVCSLPLSILISSCNDSSDNYTPEKQTIRFVETNYGISSVQPEHDESDADGQTYSSNQSIAEKTDTIPAKLGTRFGVRYMIESNYDPKVELRQVWTFPDSMHDEEGNSFITEQHEIYRTPNEENYASFIFEYPYELKKGKWQLCFYYKKHLLYRKIFVLI